MRRWLLQTLFAGLLALCALAGLTLATDSFGLFGTRLLRGAAPDSYRLTTGGDREIKAVEIARLKAADMVFVGSSRVAFAFDPSSATVAKFAVYNAGLNGSHAVEAADVVRYIVDRAPQTKRIVWNIDFEEFFREGGPQGDFAQSAFAGASVAATLARHALSYEALRKSVGGYFGAQPFYIDDKGFYHYEKRDRSALSEPGGSPELPFFNALFPGYMLTAPREYEDGVETRLAFVENALRHAREMGVAVDVVLMPTHVSRRAMFDLMGLQPQYEDWKTRLNETVARAAQHAGAPLRAFDFSEIGAIALAVFKPGGPLERSSWFFEMLHPRPIVGDMIAAKLGDAPMPSDVEPSFGAPLSDASRPERLAVDRDALRAWERDNPRLVELIAASVKAHERRQATH
jgi:hypothetical protein